MNSILLSAVLATTPVSTANIENNAFTKADAQSNKAESVLVLERGTPRSILRKKRRR